MLVQTCVIRCVKCSRIGHYLTQPENSLSYCIFCSPSERDFKSASSLTKFLFSAPVVTQSTATMQTVEAHSSLRLEVSTLTPPDFFWITVVSQFKCLTVTGPGPRLLLDHSGQLVQMLNCYRPMNQMNQLDYSGPTFNFIQFHE